MISKRIDIDKDNNVYLMAYLYDEVSASSSSQNRPAVLVCPGGAYFRCAPHEADPIALQYLAEGYNAFVLYYSLGAAAAFPKPLLDLSCAMKLIRSNCEEWHIIPNQIAVCGFSAGGHLVASLGTLWNHPEIVEKSACTQGENQPNALILIYPVITPYSWMRSHISRLVGDRDRDETLKLLDCSQNVGSHTPPAFLTHTFMDNGVSVEESLCFANAMDAHGVPFELHIFPNGPHGMGLGKQDPCYSKWMELSILWLGRLFSGKPENNPGTRARQVRD